MPTEPKYKYTTHRPSQTHQDANEMILPGHRMGWRKRRDIIGPGIAYQAYCTCKWKDSEWVPLRVIRARYSKHYNEMRKQGQLDLKGKESLL